jgi:hypothetical protein
VLSWVSVHDGVLVDRWSIGFSLAVIHGNLLVDLRDRVGTIFGIPAGCGLRFWPVWQSAMGHWEIIHNLVFEWIAVEKI